MRQKFQRLRFCRSGSQLGANGVLTAPDFSDSLKNYTSRELEAELLSAGCSAPKTAEVLRQGNLVLIENLIKHNGILAKLISELEVRPNVRAIDITSATLRRFVLQNCDSRPFINSLPVGVDASVYAAAVSLATKYTQGVEGRVHGHTLLVGDPEALLALGRRNMFDPFESGAQRHLDIRNDAVAEEMRRCMDADGMSIIDGSTGAPVANKFFSSELSENVTGGARSRSAYWIAEQASCIVILISEDSDGEFSVILGRGDGREPERAWYCAPREKDADCPRCGESCPGCKKKQGEIDALRRRLEPRWSCLCPGR